MSTKRSWSDRLRDVATRFREAAIHDGETFHRTSWTVRVELDATDGRAAVAEGLEQGGAVRRRSPEPLFGAASGDPAAAVEASRARLAPAGSGVRWSDDAGDAEDHDPGLELPAAEELEGWLRASVDGRLVEAGSAWAEVALTLECWSGGDATQTRARLRGWAGWLPREVGRMPSIPLLTAERSWQRLKAFDPRPRWVEREVRRGRDIPWPAPSRVVFSGETSSMLAHRLALVLHGRPVSEGISVGPGWKLAEQPLDPSTLLGATHDDCGNPCRNVPLADGDRITGSWATAGSLRRGSFRDAPEPVPCAVEVSPRRVEAGDDAVWVTEADLHPGGPGEWLLRLVPRSDRGIAIRPVWLRTRPERLVRDCIGGHGEPFSSIRGVRTPALVFDSRGWEVDQG